MFNTRRIMVLQIPSWMSRNMIYSGLAILAFIVLHFIDFWIPELNTKFVQGDMSGLIDPANAESGLRYFEELQHKFVQPSKSRCLLFSICILGIAL